MTEKGKGWRERQETENGAKRDENGNAPTKTLVDGE